MGGPPGSGFQREPRVGGPRLGEGHRRTLLCQSPDPVPSPPLPTRDVLEGKETQATLGTGGITDFRGAHQGRTRVQASLGRTGSIYSPLTFREHPLCADSVGSRADAAR